ncbi:hypothetical protein JVT61DRAFT_1959 [Boletus reticuloceps]|uniref:Uncharacterized protein n=1 Tax=Boletus reticuloceps TaxID=495285 RepID=A0A8I2YBV8_9AGAM|nr:hypothetical protein JVT61DRAFT_1959 [Boletus reticuloceps]
MMQQVRSSLNHIDRYPLSWRDIVACVAEFQRGVLECLAYMDYYQVIFPRCEKPSFPFPEFNQYWMGAFTTDHQIAEMLFRAGVPVWFVRHDDTVNNSTIINDIVLAHPPRGIVQAMYTDPATGTPKPFPLRYVGTDAPSRQRACRHHYKPEEMEAHAIFVSRVEPDQETPSLPSPQSAEESRKEHRKDRANSVQPYRMLRNRGNVQENRSKWIDLNHPLMPLRHILWVEALASAKSQKKDVSQAGMGAGYLFPEPASFVTPQSADTRGRYLANWLVLRPLWLGTRKVPPPLPKHWRAFLSSRPQDARNPSTGTHTGEIYKSALDFIGDILPDIAQGDTWSKDNKVSFRGTTVLLNPTTPALPDRLVQDVLWELSELCFRAELLSLDKFLAPAKWADEPLQREELYDSIFESPIIGGSWDGPLPERSFGLHHDDLHDATFLASVNSLRHLMTAWPRDGPPPVPVDNSMSEGRLKHGILQIMRFYVRRFFCHTGRPPVVPRSLPA